MGRKYIGPTAQFCVPLKVWEVVELLKSDGMREPDALREVIKAGAKQIIRKRRQAGVE